MASALGADHLHAEALKSAPLVEVHGQVERGLAAEGRQDRVRSFPLNDRLQDFDGERLNIGAVGKVRDRS